MLDLGLARLQDGTDESGTILTVEGKIVGTVDFLSPEQATNSRRADIRSDLYSLGCTFYFLLAGRPPFPEGGPIEKLANHRWEEPVPLEKLRQDVPASMIAVIRKLMAKRPEDRYQTPGEVAAALGGSDSARIAADLPSAVPVAIPVPPSVRWWRRRWRDHSSCRGRANGSRPGPRNGAHSGRSSRGSRSFLRESRSLWSC